MDCSTRRWFGVTVAAALVLGGCHGHARPAGPESRVWVEREAFLMGTLLRVQVAAPSRTAALAATESAFAEVRRLEGLLSTWQPETEVQRLNTARVGETVRLAPEVFVLLRTAVAWADSTGGAFDPVVGALIDAWQLRGRGRVPGEADLAAALAASGIHRLVLDSVAGTALRRDSAAWVDTGGFGKGAALRAVERVLRGSGVRSALVDFGGQVLALGEAAEGGAWPVAVAHPTRRREPATWLRLRNRSAATSSASERFVEPNGERFGHILDPRTGRPVPAWGSVTVVAADALVADIVSTALFVLGPRHGMEWAQGREDVGVLFLIEQESTVTAWWNEAMEPYRESDFSPVERKQ